jgi:hypothetical protein
MLMMLGVAVVLLGLVIGFTDSGTGISRRAHRRDRLDGESPLDSGWTMDEWSRGTQSRARRRK